MELNCELIYKDFLKNLNKVNLVVFNQEILTLCSDEKYLCALFDSKVYILFAIAKNTFKDISQVKNYMKIILNNRIKRVCLEKNFYSFHILKFVKLIRDPCFKDTFTKNEINSFMQEMVREFKRIPNMHLDELADFIDDYPVIFDSYSNEVKAGLNKEIEIWCGKAKVFKNESAKKHAFSFIRTYASDLEINNFKLLFEILIHYLNHDILFNHLNNSHSGSILSYINAIKDTDLKVAQMEVVINYLNEQNIADLIAPIKDVLYSNEIYLKSKTIRSFCLKKLLADIYISANTKAIQFTPIEAWLIAKDINDKNTQAKELFMLENNNLLNQIFYFGTTIENNLAFIKNSNLLNQIFYFGTNIKNNLELNDLIKTIKTIEEAYLNLAKIKTPLIEGALSYFADIDEKALVFINNSQVLVISKAYYEAWALGKNMNTPVVNGFWYIDNANKAIEHPTELFKTFSLFASTYAFIENKRLFVELIKLLNLKQYAQHFFDAIKNTCYNTKFVSAQHQNDFAKILAPLVEGGDDIISLTGKSVINIKLTEKHFKDILAIYKSINSNQDTQAAIFLCLSALFIKYTTSAFFGIEVDSITSLRNYVLALLNKALELKPDIIDSKYLMDNAENWRYKMCGYNGAFSCTAVLSENSCTAVLSANMIREIKRKFPDILNVLLPPAWQ